ncbi:transglycosylase SLT domain-containing protein [Frateuria hangzhouensis]|uniref:transglycosylase SLT domain-containing protein n=1 Tax=Frateuria hangzhouensis TaxID=2995589 RepID=UPI002260F9BD|nr:transglycosylase SLT domain-containing protein [Frateuria sp. STR12]MCX7514551.1 transglycosylase SLT domain-containing protein [Frateuria sp. STR12]
MTPNASPAARVRQPSSYLLLALIAWFGLAAMVHAAPSPDEQRVAFKQAWAVAQQGGDGWRTWAKGLTDYPLYPYLEAAALEHDVDTLDRATVADFLKRHPDLLPAGDLRRAWLHSQARRHDWSDFLALYQPGLGDALACDALQAKLAQGGTLDFQRDLAPLWDSANLPGACDPVLDAANDAGLLTNTRLWARIDRALDAGQGGTVAALATWLPGAEGKAAARLAQALRDPATAVADAVNWPDTPRHRQAASLALQRLARRDTDAADAGWQRLRPHFSFSDDQRDGVLYALALFHATDFDEHALARLAALPAAAQTDTSREWRARVALARQDWPAVLTAIEAMPATQRDEDEWRYFQARALAATGHGDRAATLYDKLAQEATYYGFLAADRVQDNYAICPLDPPDDTQREQALQADPGLQRAFELFAVDLPHLARREWSRALAGADTTTRRLAARLAYERQWYDRAVFTYSSGEAMHYYDQRFPLASQDGVVPQAQQAGIDPSWAYAIARAESAWMSDAHSGADARGLMQLVPATAAQVAKRNGLDWGGGQSLYDPAVNIMLGTRYLAQMASRFNGAPWLASAAYNAGPNKVDQWLGERGALPPDLFVATIPYHETRDYVARVMAFAVIYDWRLSGKALPLGSRMPAIGQPYSLPDVHTPRKDVTCPSASPASAVATAGGKD